MIRLNKYMAECGVASRRACDKLISEGAVKVNGKLVTQLGTVIEETNDTVICEGRMLTPVRKNYYIVLHKPKGYICSVSDEKGRKTVMDLIDVKTRLYPVGRLDYDTEGMLILTNDGDLANALMHPKHEINKYYKARIEGSISESELMQLRNGVVIEGKKTAPAVVRILEKSEDFTTLEVVIHEGRNHQIKKMFETVGKNVVFLKRTAIGDLRLGGLARGKYKHLSPKEIEILKNMTE
ncbi:MAG: pseudouridine synthase [Clostridia bacterium]|nr:pseudouridine synthase [Clostridia bacterium]